MVGDLVVIGQVTRPHGVRGELRVYPFTETAESFSGFKRVYLRCRSQSERIVEVLEARPHKNIVLLTIKGVRTVEEAQTLTGAEVLVKREWLPELEPDEYYWTDLIGMSVFDENGQSLGSVENMFDTGADDMMVLLRQGRETMIPFREEIIIDIDLGGQKIIVRPPEGLLDI